MVYSQVLTGEELKLFQLFFADRHGSEDQKKTVTAVRGRDAETTLTACPNAVPLHQPLHPLFAYADAPVAQFSPDARPPVGSTILCKNCADLNQHCLIAQVAALENMPATGKVFMVRVKTQETQLQRTPGALVMGSSLAFAAAFPVVKDEPYIANVLMQDIRSTPDGIRSVHEAFNVHMRDSAGRLRDEQLASPPDSQGGFVQACVQVLDPVAMQDFQWNKDTKTVFTGVIPASFINYRQSPIISYAQCIAASHADGLTHNPSQCQEIYEDLGERMIEGINAHGCRITRTSPIKRVSSAGRPSDR